MAPQVRTAALPPDRLRAKEVYRQPPDATLAAPASSNSLFKGNRAGSHQQAGGAQGGNGAQRAAQQPQPGARRPREEKLKRLGPLQWIGIIGVHSHLFDNKCKGGPTTLAHSGGGGFWTATPTRQPDDDLLELCGVQGCSAVLDTHGRHRAACTARSAATANALPCMINFRMACIGSFEDYRAPRRTRLRFQRTRE